MSFAGHGAEAFIREQLRTESMVSLSAEILNHFLDRLEKTEAENKRLREALENIVGLSECVIPAGAKMAGIAKQALADKPLCPSCKNGDKMMKHDDGKWYCHETHIFTRD